MKRYLTFLLVLIILIITNLGCASKTSNGTEMYKYSGYNYEIKYYDSKKGESCGCPEIKKPKYICECIDSASLRK
jgi:hypothetical protein